MPHFQKPWRVWGVSLLVSKHVSLPQVPGCWQKIWDPKVRKEGVYNIHSTSGRQDVSNCTVSLSFNSDNVKKIGPGDACTHGELSYRPRTLSLENQLCYIISYKHAWSSPCREIVSRCCWTITSLPFLQRKTLPLFRDCLLFKYPWEVSPKQRWSMLLSARCAET